VEHIGVFSLVTKKNIKEPVKRSAPKVDKGTVSKVTASVLADFRSKHTYSAATMTELFAFGTVAKLSSVLPSVKKVEKDGAEKYHEPLSDRSRAMVYRAYSQFPELLPNIDGLSIRDVFEMFRRVYGPFYITTTTFSQLLGRSDSSGIRWLERAGEINPAVAKILEILQKLLNSGMSEVAVCKAWVAISKQEANSRGEIFIFDRLDLDRERFNVNDEEAILASAALAKKYDLDVRARYFGTKEFLKWAEMRKKADGFDSLFGLTTQADYWEWFGKKKSLRKGAGYGVRKPRLNKSTGERGVARYEATAERPKLRKRPALKSKAVEPSKERLLRKKPAAKE
jgi:hypothetical protein